MYVTYTQKLCQTARRRQPSHRSLSPFPSTPQGKFLLLASSLGAVAVAHASNTDESLVWRQVIPLAAPVLLPPAEVGGVGGKEAAVEIMEVALHPQKRLVLALSR
jgi:hypothetical protein